jgi:PAS domain-containing protein
MVELAPNSAALLAILAGAWLCAGAWSTSQAVRKLRAARAERLDAERKQELVAGAPASWLLIYPDGRLEGLPRLAGLLGMPGLPDNVSELQNVDSAFARPDLVRVVHQSSSAATSGAEIFLTCRPEGSSCVLAVRAAPAPPPYRSGTILLWFTDVTESENQLSKLRNEVERQAAALDSLSALIEAAPFPMWHRGPDLRLAMVNSAYVSAVEAGDALAVVKSGIELVDETEDRSPLSQAAAVLEKGEAVARTVPATIAGERRTMMVVEVPLGDTGVAGYAIDVEDREQARADLARFDRAQRDMLDRLSAGVAQFGRDRSLIFFNQPFARLFSLRADFLADRPEFNRVLDSMRERGNLPEVRDYPNGSRRRGAGSPPAFRRTRRIGCFRAASTSRRRPAASGRRPASHLRGPDRADTARLGPRHIASSPYRHFDNLFEAIGVFASDGRLHLWNNRFRETWQFEEEQLAAHPRVDALTPLIAKKLKNANHAGLVRELVRSATVERKQRSGHVSFTDGRDFEFAAVPLPDGNALFTMLDVTDSRMIEAALRERNEALEDADRLKTAFVSNMSYELRTPLTSIAGFAEMLAGGLCGRAAADGGRLCAGDPGVGAAARES